MADRSAYAPVGGYGSGYMGANASTSGYAREEYAWGSSNNGGNGGQQQQQQPQPQPQQPQQQQQQPPGVTKPRTDQSCYLGP